jgi:type I restriction enzyme S subunit
MPKGEMGWTLYRFDKMARFINDRVDNPADSGVERYVGLEHLDPESLRIRRWGEVTDVESTKLRFQPGDIIFGKRRVYQRKLAVADFEGICSAHAMVLRAKRDVVLPEFLPFFMQSDRFMERALRISVGSLSPTINWTALANEQFALPPIEEQRRMASALTSGAKCQGAYMATADSADRAREALIENRMRGLSLGPLRRHVRLGLYHDTWRVRRLGELLTIAQYGLSDVATSNGEFPMLRMMNIDSGQAVENDLKYVDLRQVDYQRYRLETGDVLFNRTNSYELVGRTGVYELGGKHVFASYLVRLRTDAAALDPAYLCAFLNAPIGRRQVMSYATRGVSQTNVSASSLKRILIPLPPLEYQKETTAALRSMSDVASSARARAAGVGAVIARMINTELAR